jgi:hypothetical protein
MSLLNADGRLYVDVSAKSTRTQQRTIDHIWSVGSCKRKDTPLSQSGVQLSEQLR